MQTLRNLLYREAEHLRRQFALAFGNKVFDLKQFSIYVSLPIALNKSTTPSELGAADAI